MNLTQEKLMYAEPLLQRSTNSTGAQQRSGQLRSNWGGRRSLAAHASLSQFLEMGFQG